MNNQVAGPLMVSIDVTYKCNFRCLHCFNGSGENCLNNELTDNELEGVFKEVSEIRPTVVCFCGGEPTLRSQQVLRGCEIIRTNTNGNTSVNMVTNGSLVTPELAQEIKRTGFSVVQVSLDGSRKETHEWLRNKEGSFDLAIRAIKNLVSAGVSVGVAFTPTLRNMHEFEQVATLCSELGVSDFRIQPLMPLGRALDNLGEYMPGYHDYAFLSRKLQQMKYENLDKKPRFDWGDPVDHIIRFSSDKVHYNPMIGINAYGEIYISPYIPVTFGSIKKHSIREYWDAGLSKAWDIRFIKELSDMIYDIPTLNLKASQASIPKVYYESSFCVDLLNNPFKKIHEMTLDELFKTFKKNY